MKKKLNYADIIKETVILTVAVAIIAAAVYFFLVPSHASVSSISGLGIVLSNFVPLPLSAITMILNVVLLIIGCVTVLLPFVGLALLALFYPIAWIGLLALLALLPATLIVWTYRARLARLLHGAESG